MPAVSVFREFGILGLLRLLRILLLLPRCSQWVSSVSTFLTTPIAIRQYSLATDGGYSNIRNIGYCLMVRIVLMNNVRQDVQNWLFWWSTLFAEYFERTSRFHTSHLWWRWAIVTNLWWLLLFQVVVGCLRKGVAIPKQQKGVCGSAKSFLGGVNNFISP